MSKLLTIDEIRSRYNGEWAVLTDIEPHAHANVIRHARVAYHGDEDESCRRAGEIGWDRCRVVYLGDSLPDREVGIITRLLVPDWVYEITPEMIEDARRHSAHGSDQVMGPQPADSA